MHRTPSMMGGVWMCVAFVLSAMHAAPMPVYASPSWQSRGDVAAVDPSSIDTVHLLFMNHLDVGFDGINPTLGFAYNVINRYFDVYFPNAVSVALQLRARGGNERLIYTSHPWLVWMYLNCAEMESRHLLVGPVHCPNATALAGFDGRIKAGDITWHAWPFNMQAEFLSSEGLLESALSFARALDATYSMRNKTVISQRDVPGTTRAAIPSLVKNGVRAISVGVNGASPGPEVPTAFVWRHTDAPAAGAAPASSDLIGMWHPGGYGGYGISDAVLVQNFSQAMVWDFRGDNAGPPSVNEVISVFAQVSQEFPKAKVIASTYEAFVDQLMTVKQTLPVVTQEIGDTWIHGVASDPLKTSYFRAVARVRDMCIGNNNCGLSSKDMLLFDFNLIKCAEHTWGMDVKTFLADWVDWSNAQLQEKWGATNFQNLMMSWVEQRQYLDMARSVANNTALGRGMDAVLADIKAPSAPSTKGFVSVPPSKFGDAMTAGRFTLALNSSTGAIIMLKDSKTGRSWASSSSSLGGFTYSTYSQADVQTFMSEYLICDIVKQCPWANGDFGKPNMTSQHNDWDPTLAQLFYSANKTANTFQILTSLTMPQQAYTVYGSPQEVWVQMTIPLDGNEIEMQYTLIGKVPTRLVEGLYVSFSPLVAGQGAFAIEKLGHLIEPSDVVAKGSVHLHAVNSIHYADGQGRSFSVRTVDAPVVSYGPRSAFPTPVAGPLPNTTSSFHFNLYNNIWGTNYIMWYPFEKEDKNILYRFVLEVN